MLQPLQDLDSEVALFARAAERFALAPHRTTGAELAQDMLEVSRCLSLVQVKFSEMAAAFAATDHYDVEGSYSPIHWIRQNCHVTVGAAVDRIAVGQQLAQLQNSIEALVSGEIGFNHLSLIAREAEAHDESGVEHPFEEGPLLTKAVDFSVGKFRNFCHHQRHATNPERYAAEEAEKVEARKLSLTTGEGGILWIRGVLDPEGGAVLRAALEPLARKSGQSDHRDPQRRLGDALVELAQPSERALLQVTASLDALLQLAGAPAADVEQTIPLSAASVQRLSCDCSVARILLGAESQVVDVGRSKRVISPALRRALEVRDKGCRWPGCERPASYTAGHHLVHWSKGGSTDLANLVLLCRRHHWMVHEGKWQIVKTDDEFVVVPPQLFHLSTRAPDNYDA